MNRKLAGFLMAVSCGALLAGGCAKSEVVKKDEPLARSAAVAAPAKAQPPQEKVRMKEAPESPVAKESPKVAAEPVIPVKNKMDQAGELKTGLQKIYFNFDSASLSDRARNALVKNADLLKRDGKAKVRVEGNCDERGSDDYNLALGEKRAKQAVQYLASLGVPAERLTAISYGKEKPVAPGHDEQSWAQNRRDEFVITP
jgi:peptidoglycan-associated lipoprotein